MDTLTGSLIIACFCSLTPPIVTRSNLVYRACPAGHYCPAGSTSPKDCVAGTYQNDTAAADCDICPDRHYCEATATETLTCPAGFYCPEGTEFATEFPCPNGTYSNETSLAAVSECLLCPPGRLVFVLSLSAAHGVDERCGGVLFVFMFLSLPDNNVLFTTTYVSLPRTKRGKRELSNTRLFHAYPPQVLWERGPQRTGGTVWSRVLLRARGNFTSP